MKLEKHKNYTAELHKVSVSDKLQENKIMPWVIIAFMAIMYTIANQIFIAVAGTVPVGVMAIAVLLSYVIEGLDSYSSLIYLGLNIPLLLFFWKKSKPRWIRKTAFFIVIQASFGCLFLIDSVSDAFVKSFFLAHTETTLEGFRNEIWPIIILAGIGAVFGGIAMAYTWKYGGSTGGTDIVVNYISNTKNKSVGGVSRAVSIAIGIISYSIIVAVNPDGQQKLWLPLLLGTFIYIIVLTNIVDKIYPKYSKVRLDIYSEKIAAVNKSFKDDKYWHAWNVIPYTSGHGGHAKEMISTTIYLVELREILRMIGKIDENAWISVVNIKNSYGNFDKSYIERR